jgi:hypothetical protein
MQKRCLVIGCLAAGWLSSSTWPQSDNSKHAYAWWQTSCERFQTEPDLVVAVFLREFPMRDQTANDRAKSRAITFESTGLGVRLGERRFAVRATDVKIVSVRALGKPADNRGSAFELTITTTNGLLTGGPLGTIELHCWRGIESVIATYPSTKIVGSPPMLDVPLRDKDNNVIPE